MRSIGKEFLNKDNSIQYDMVSWRPSDRFDTGVNNTKISDVLKNFVRPIRKSQRSFFIK